MGRHSRETHTPIRAIRFAIAAGLMVVSWIAVQGRTPDLRASEQPIQMALPTAAPQVMVLPSAVPIYGTKAPPRPSATVKLPVPTPAPLPAQPAVVEERVTSRRQTLRPSPKQPPAPAVKSVATTSVAPTMTPSKPVVKPVPVPVPQATPRPVVKPAPMPVVSGHAGLVGIAKSYIGIGIRYVFGGKAAPALDCSGFVWVVLKRAGYDVPYRSSSALKAWATPISKSQAQPGDLVFWPGHVGFYSGPGTVVDNGTSAGPKVTTIWGSPTYGRIPV